MEFCQLAVLCLKEERLSIQPTGHCRAILTLKTALALKHNPMHSSSSEIFLNISIDEVCMYIMTSFYAIMSFAMMSNLTFFQDT